MKEEIHPINVIVTVSSVLFSSWLIEELINNGIDVTVFIQSKVELLEKFLNNKLKKYYLKIIEYMKIVRNIYETNINNCNSYL